VGDSLPAQVQVLAPTSPGSIQNSGSVILQTLCVRDIFCLHCLYYLLNLTVQEALNMSMFMNRYKLVAISLIHVLRRRDNHRRIGTRSLTGSQMRSCRILLLCPFFALHFEAVQETGIEISLQALGFGAMIEAILKLIFEFEGRMALFDLNEGKLCCFVVRMSKLQKKFNQIDYIVHCCDILSGVGHFRWSRDFGWELP
jgi:hypothetical protein